MRKYKAQAESEGKIMKSDQLPHRYIALLRGINVGGHHKVPMAGLRKGLAKLGFTNITTVLNSGNVIFETTEADINKLEQIITEKLEKLFGFPVPTILTKAENILHIQNFNPFKNIKVTKNIRLYVSFLKQKPGVHLNLPWVSKDNSYRILNIKDRIVFSVLDLSFNKTPKVMETLEQTFGKEITTRNWNTISKIINIFSPK